MPDEILAEFDKNASEVVRVTRSNFKGHQVIDLRCFYEADGDLRPSRKGLTIGLKKLPELTACLIEVCEKLGLEPGPEPE